MRPSPVRSALRLLPLVLLAALLLAAPALAQQLPEAVAPVGSAAAAGHAPAAPSGTSAVNLITIFVVAIYLGVELINKVPPTLHTPLMSGSNAISGITVVGALTCAYKATDPLVANVMGAVGVAAAMINVVGGFMVTDRMLEMFKAPDKKAGAK
jgi:H+-translocating NAD(P) transhydrogenase subunit alpha